MAQMLHHVVLAKPLGGSRLHLQFDDGVEGQIDVRSTGPLRGVFAPLADPEYFARVTVNPDFGTVCWPNGADIDTEILYSGVTGKPLPTWGGNSKAPPRERRRVRSAATRNSRGRTRKAPKRRTGR